MHDCRRRGLTSLEIKYHDLPLTMELSNFILDVINKALDDKNKLYNSARVGAQGQERQSVHRDMHKIPASRHALAVFYGENYGLDANNGIDTIILLGSRGDVSIYKGHIMYENGVATRKGATCCRRGSGLAAARPADVRYMDLKVAEYVGQKEKGMLGGRTHVKGMTSSRMPKPKVERKGKTTARSGGGAGDSFNTDTVVENLADVASHAADEACRSYVRSAKP